ncbi:MAG: disulfide bond formation protein B [Candidatus Accumulibacter delftensis]|jgi:hypothetical protein
MACGFGEPTVIEQIVNWFGVRWPDLFLATGFCSSKDWVFLGLSMANWSIVCFLAVMVAAAQLVRGKGQAALRAAPPRWQARVAQERRAGRTAAVSRGRAAAAAPRWRQIPRRR